MKLTCDPRHNIACLRFQEKTAEAGAIQFSGALNVDIAPGGTVCGIELLNANGQLRGDNGHFLVVNEAAGKTRDILVGISRMRREHRIGGCSRPASRLCRGRAVASPAHGEARASRHGRLTPTPL